LEVHLGERIFGFVLGFSGCSSLHVDTGEWSNSKDEAATGGSHRGTRDRRGPDPCVQARTFGWDRDFDHEEPGVLMLNAVSVKDHPTQVRIFETYKDQSAYESHLQSPHFKKYKDVTHGMVKSLKLIETEPIMLAGK
jgi:hypothetical protein